jgi:hypothetical protein
MRQTSNPERLPSCRLAGGMTFFDDSVKSPSAALRFNFVVAVHPEVRLTPQFLRAWHLELFTKSSGQRLFTRSSIIEIDN